MGAHSNQHYVPQFYIKQFSTDKKRICLLRIKDGKIITGASILGQCKKRNIYGSEELEKSFALIEGKHSKAIRTILQVAWNESAPLWSEQDYMCFLQSLLFQRARTVHQAEKVAPALENTLLQLFKESLEEKDDADIIKEIDDGCISISEKMCATVGRNIQAALECVPLILDLDIHLLLNKTELPFIFSDAPVIFINTYLHNIKTRGTLGLQLPGFQIFWPLDSRTMVMLLDGTKYEGPYKNRLRYDITTERDVTQINALQLHNSMDTIYFGVASCTKYVANLWRTHRSTIKMPIFEYHTRRDLLIDGHLTEHPILHVFEPQLNYMPDISFLKCEPVSARQYHPSFRRPDIIAKLEQEMELKKASSKAGS